MPMIQIPYDVVQRGNADKYREIEEWISALINQARIIEQERNEIWSNLVAKVAYNKYPLYNDYFTAYKADNIKFFDVVVINDLSKKMMESIGNIAEIDKEIRRLKEEREKL